jgi:hypothetical protein
MHDGMSQSHAVRIVLDKGGSPIRCADMSLEDLIHAAESASSIRAASQTCRVTTPMHKLTASLEAIRGTRENDQYGFLLRSISDSREEVHQDSRLRVLAGLSPDESILFVVFVSPWISHCFVEAVVAS